MRAAFLIAAITIFSGSNSLAADKAGRTIALTKPTIIILVAPKSEQRRYKDDSEYNEFSGDFAVYANRLISTLRPYPNVTIRWSDADAVTFPGTSFKPVQRRELETEWGYVFFRPGAPPVVHAGVAEDEYLICIAAKLYGLTIQGHKCEA
jgi:hypothetical protein